MQILPQRHVTESRADEEGNKDNKTLPGWERDNKRLKMWAS